MPSRRGSAPSSCHRRRCSPSLLVGLAALAGLVAPAACGSQPEGSPRAGGPTAGAQPPLRLPHEGAGVRVQQRSSAAVPGSDGALQIALGDITAGQVQLTLGKTDGSAVLLSRSVRTGDEVAFTLAGFGYQLVVEDLHNDLIGTDWADLRVRPGSDDAATPAPPAVDEAARIEGLLAKLEASGVTFIRNGSEHDAREAAEHLRNKWAHAPSIDTAERFIDELGTRSSSSGQPYRVRLRDGREQDAGPWLHSLLSHDPTR
ncbi:MAG: DUF5329 domain-containing protein [Deltaproteobacteria bacterium]|nr:DUF5329 domain-containing protein [Deltaproteobacteria bacterium]MBP7285428.1 DUF5329 domain-containing protein [Nannocystaceae bacterium]